MLRYAQHDKFACSINLRYHVILNEVKNLKHATTKMLRYAQHDKIELLTSKLSPIHFTHRSATSRSNKAPVSQNAYAFLLPDG